MHSGKSLLSVDEKVGEEDSDGDADSIMDVGEVIDKLGLGGFQAVLIIFCGLVFMTEACEIVMLSLLMPTLKKKWDLHSSEEGMIGSCVFVGMLIGSSFFGYMSDNYGRKTAIIISAAITGIFGLLSSVCFTYFEFLVCRFVVGFSVGGSGVTTSLFTEYLPTEERGKWLLLINCFWTLGTCFETGIGWLILSHDDFFHGYAWNIYVACSCLPLVLVFLMLPLITESLRFQALKGDEREIRKTIEWMEYLNCKKILHPTTKLKLRVNEKSENKGGIRLLFRSPIVWVFLNMCLLYMCGSFSYYGVTMSTPDFFKTQREKYFGAFVSSFAEFGGIFVPLFFLSWFGRKQMISILFFLYGLGLIGLSVIPIHNLLFRLLFSLVLRATTLSAYGFVAIMAQESFPTNARSSGIGFAGSMGKVATVLSPFVTKMYPWDESNTAKIIFCVVAFVASILAIIHPYETSNRRLVDFVGGDSIGKQADGIKSGRDSPLRLRRVTNVFRDKDLEDGEASIAKKEEEKEGSDPENLDVEIKLDQ